MRLHHIKLHGGLYHASEEHPALAGRYVETVRRWWPGCVIYVRAGGRVASMARRKGVEAWEEAFADRNYRDDGSVVPRGAPNALVTGPEVVRERVRRWLADGELLTESGRTRRLRPGTICLHSDTPNAPRLALVLARALGRKLAR